MQDYIGDAYREFTKPGRRQTLANIHRPLACTTISGVMAVWEMFKNQRDAGAYPVLRVKNIQ